MNLSINAQLRLFPGPSRGALAFHVAFHLLLKRAIVCPRRPEIIEASAGDRAEHDKLLSHSIWRPALYSVPVLGKLHHDPEGTMHEMSVELLNKAVGDELFAVHQYMFSISTAMTRDMISWRCFSSRRPSKRCSTPRDWQNGFCSSKPTSNRGMAKWSSQTGHEPAVDRVF